MSDTKLDKLYINAEFYLKRIEYYSVTIHRFNAVRELDFFNGYGEIPFTMDKAGHERFLAFWKDSLIWFMNRTVRQNVKDEEIAKKP